MNRSWCDYIDLQLRHLGAKDLLRKRAGLARRIEATASDSNSDATSDQKTGSVLDFGSNDYLGLRLHREIRRAAQRAAEEYGWGSGASPVLGGHQAVHAQLEQALASLCNQEDALVFPSGFACNLGVLSCLLDQQTIVFSDRLNHASLIDGIRLSRAERAIYNHCDLEHLREQLYAQRGRCERSVIVTESVFSMDGDQAPLIQLVELAQQFNCGLIVDEAHALGLFGARGSGLVEELGLSAQVMIKLGTLSKALGGVGGYAAGSTSMIDFLVSRCRSYLFSTAPPAAAMAASLAAVQLLPSLSAQRQNLLQLAHSLRRRLADMGWNVPAGRSPIIPILVGTASAANELSRQLIERRIYVPAIRPPTVPEGTSRLRISLSARHTLQDIDRLCQALSCTARS